MTMKTLKSRTVVASLGLLTMVSALLAFVPQQPPADNRPAPPPPQSQPDRRPPFDRGPGGPGGPGGRQISVSAAMKGINRAAKQLHAQITDPAKKAENLQLINDIERGAVSAKGAPLPADVLAKAKDEAGKAKMTEDFRRALMKAVRTALDIEENLLAGKTDAAKTGLDDLITQRDAAHTALGVEMDEDER